MPPFPSFRSRRPAARWRRRRRRAAAIALVSGALLAGAPDAGAQAAADQEQCAATPVTGSGGSEGGRSGTVPVAQAPAAEEPRGAEPARRAAPPAPFRIRVVGGRAGLSQYTRHEEPFWRDRIPRITGGRVLPEIAPFDRTGIRGADMLRLIRLGVVPFGTVPLALAGSEEPELEAADLPGVNPDMATLRRSVALYRPHLAARLAERYQVELLAIYTYPAQVAFCRRPFAGLSDLAWRRIRTASLAQSEWVAALGGIPVPVALAETVATVRSGVVECAISGTMSGNAIGLHEVTSHVHAMAINWGLSVFGANRAAWSGLPPELADLLRREIAELERAIWDDADRETGEGLACNAGRPECRSGRPGRMTIVPVTPADEALRRRLVVEAVLPRWVRRCGADCVAAWNARLAPALGITAGPD